MTQASSRISIVLAAALLAACQGQGMTPSGDAHTFVSSLSDAKPDTEQSVAYQLNPDHTGFAPGSMKLPLKELWSDEIGGQFMGVGFPVIANNFAVVTANERLYGLDVKTGHKLWMQLHPNTDFDGWVGSAYSDGKIFASPSSAFGKKSLGMFAFDEQTGKQLWSSGTPGQFSISNAPTTGGGMVYTVAAGTGATIYAYDETTGAMKWSTFFDGSDDSSPVVTPTGVYVSYTCPQTFDFDPKTGKQIWTYDGPCFGGGGSTPVLYNGLLYVGLSQVSTKFNGLILNAKTGKAAGGFNSNFTPAFANGSGYFASTSTLEAQSVPSMKERWTAKLDTNDKFVTPPLIVGSVVYLVTFSNNLVGYSVSDGKQIVTMTLPPSNKRYHDIPSSLGYGDGELLVPDGSHLIAFSGS